MWLKKVEAGVGALLNEVADNPLSAAATQSPDTSKVVVTRGVKLHAGIASSIYTVVAKPKKVGLTSIQKFSTLASRSIIRLEVKSTSSRLRT